MREGFVRGLNIQLSPDGGGGGGAAKKQKFEPGVTYEHAYEAPGKAPKGFFWELVGRHLQKGYPLKWTLRSTDPEPPSMDDLPPIDSHGKAVDFSQGYQEPLPGIKD